VTLTLFRGAVVHRRLRPLAHRFAYPAAFIAVALPTLEACARGSLMFGYNRLALSSIRDRDYLERGSLCLREKLARRMPHADPERTVLVTMPRTLLPAFNPLSLYLARDAGGALVRVGAEVANTFHERWFYDLAVRREGPTRYAAEAAKVLYVSPFLGTNGTYRFHFDVSETRLHARIELRIDGAPAIRVALSGSARPFPSSIFSPALWALAASGALALPRIALQALRLRARGLRTVMKPHPPRQALRSKHE
jgi:DUF1365 family protein